MPIATCEYCRKEFEYIKDGNRTRRFCNLRCYGDWMKENEFGEKAHNWRGSKKRRICPVCGEVFYSRDSERKMFCSRFCYGKHKSLEMSHPDYNHYKKHGMAKTRTYRVWAGMKDRATNIKGRDATNYIGRGIGVCDRWLFFENFLEDMGEAPEGMTLERIDVNGDYGPHNCRWASLQEQLNNTRRNIIITYNGVSDTLANWARILGFKYEALLNRYHRNWSIERMMTTPLLSKKREAA